MNSGAWLLGLLLMAGLGYALHRYSQERVFAVLVSGGVLLLTISLIVTIVTHWGR